MIKSRALCLGLNVVIKICMSSSPRLEIYIQSYAGSFVKIPSFVYRLSSNPHNVFLVAIILKPCILEEGRVFLLLI